MCVWPHDGQAAQVCTCCPYSFEWPVMRDVVWEMGRVQHISWVVLAPTAYRSSSCSDHFALHVASFGHLIALTSSVPSFYSFHPINTLSHSTQSSSLTDTPLPPGQQLLQDPHRPVRHRRAQERHQGDGHPQVGRPVPQHQAG